MSAAPAITRRLDAVQAELPPIPANALELIRAGVRRTTDTVTTISDQVAERSAVVGRTIGRASKTAVGQATSATQRAVRFADDRRREALGQVSAQTSIVVDAVEQQSADALDDAAASVDPQRPLTELTKAELYEMAQTKDIAGRASMSKRELVAALQR